MKENEALLLRFKYYSFFDLNPKVPRTHTESLFFVVLLSVHFVDWLFGSLSRVRNCLC